MVVKTVITRIHVVSGAVNELSAAHDAFKPLDLISVWAEPSTATTRIYFASPPDRCWHGRFFSTRDRWRRVSQSDCYMVAASIGRSDYAQRNGYPLMVSQKCTTQDLLDMSQKWLKGRSSN